MQKMKRLKYKPIMNPDNPLPGELPPLPPMIVVGFLRSLDNKKPPGAPR